METILDGEENAHGQPADTDKKDAWHAGLKDAGSPVQHGGGGHCGCVLYHFYKIITEYTAVGIQRTDRAAGDAQEWRDGERNGGVWDYVAAL